MTMSVEKFRRWTKAPEFEKDDAAAYEVLSRVRVDDCITITEIHRIRSEEPCCITE